MKKSKKRKERKKEELSYLRFKRGAKKEDYGSFLCRKKRRTFL
jgi:hypothetical protein